LAQDQLKWVEGILDSPPDDCVKTLAFEGKTYLENRRVVEDLSKAATDANLGAIQTARRVLDEQWPILQARSTDGNLQKPAEEIASLLKSNDCLLRVEALKAATGTLATAYRQVYSAAFERRGKAYTAALEMVKGRPEWLIISGNPEIPAEQKEAILQPLSVRAGAEMDLPNGATVCRRTGATLAQLESEAEAVDVIAGQALRKLMELVAPKEKLERVSVAKLYPSRITGKEEMEEFLAALRERLEKILAQRGTIILE